MRWSRERAALGLGLALASVALVLTWERAPRRNVSAETALPAAERTVPGPDLVAPSSEHATSTARSPAMRQALDAPASARGEAPLPQKPALERDTSDDFLGRVRAGPRGEPLAGVEVHARTGADLPPLPGKREPEACSDERGEFRLRRTLTEVWLVAAEFAPRAISLRRATPKLALRDSRPPPLSWNADATTQLFVAPTDAPAEPPGHEVHEFTLWPAATLELVLVGPLDALCRWMAVRVDELPDDAPSSLAAPARVHRTEHLDDTQRARFTDLRTDVAYRLALGGHELEPALELSPGETRVLTIRCPFLAVSGHVLDPAGRALEDARVTIAGLSVQSASDGSFAFTSLTAGTHLVRVTSADHRWSLHLPLVLADSPADLWLRLAPCATLRVDVREADGQPATGRLWLQRSGEPDTRFELPLDPAGSLVLDDLEDVEFELGHVELQKTLARVRASQGTLALVLPERPRTSPRPEDADAPLPRESAPR